MKERQYIKSLFCSDAACVEVAIETDGIFVRNSTCPTDKPVRFTKNEWSAFVGGVKAGQFDV